MSHNHCHGGGSGSGSGHSGSGHSGSSQSGSGHSGSSHSGSGHDHSGGHVRTPNDDRSDTLNPNNPAYWADQANRARQGARGGGYDDSGDDDSYRGGPAPAIPPSSAGPGYGPTGSWPGATSTHDTWSGVIIFAAGAYGLWRLARRYSLGSRLWSWTSRVAHSALAFARAHPRTTVALVVLCVFGDDRRGPSALSTVLILAAAAYGVWRLARRYSVGSRLRSWIPRIGSKLAAFARAYPKTTIALVVLYVLGSIGGK